MMTSRMITRNPVLQVAALVWASSLLPTAHAYCYIDFNGFERCTLGTGARIGIAVALIVLAMLFAGLAMMGIKRRRARMQQQNLAYVHNPVQNNQGYYYNGAAAPGYYPPPNGPGGPQYPPQSYTPYQGPGGYDPTTGFAPPQYAPPSGPPPATEQKV